MNDPDRFLRRPKLAPMLLAIAASAGSTAYFAYRCATNDLGLIVNDLIYLQTTGATIFYGLFAGLSLIFFLMGSAGLIHTFAREHYVVFHPTAIELPPTLLRRAKRIIPFSEIHSLERWEVNRQIGITIRHRHGTDGIARSVMGADAFDAIVERLRKQLP